MNKFLNERKKNIKELVHLNVEIEYLNDRIKDLTRLKNEVNNRKLVQSNLANSNLVFLLGTGYEYDIIPVDYYYAYDFGTILPVEKRKVEWDYVDVSAILNTFNKGEMDPILAKRKSMMVDALVQESVRTHSFDNWTVLKEHLKIVSEAIRNEFSNTSKSLKK